MSHIKSGPSCHSTLPGTARSPVTKHTQLLGPDFVLLTLVSHYAAQATPRAPLPEQPVWAPSVGGRSRLEDWAIPPPAAFFPSQDCDDTDESHENDNDLTVEEAVRDQVASAQTSEKYSEQNTYK
jgi:hypothetical protein